MDPSRKRGHKPPGYYREKASPYPTSIPAKRRKRKPRKPQSQPDAVAPAPPPLDLTKSYVGEWTPPAPPERTPRQTRWQHTGEDPITDVRRAPEGWNPHEPDLDPDDMDAQIARCHERIADKIMPLVFETKLAEFETEKAKREAMMAAEPGLSWNVVQRLEDLKGITNWLIEVNDQYSLLPNVNAIMAAYRSGALDWYPGLVTYWSYGTQICQPRPFVWDEFMRVNRQHSGHTGFWVEGIHGPGPLRQMLGLKSLILPTSTSNTFANWMRFRLRFPGREHQWDFDFMDDTGADLMRIYEGDLQTLRGYDPDFDQSNPTAIDLPPLLGGIYTGLANGTWIGDYVRAIEVNIRDVDGHEMTEWDPVQCIIMPGNAPVRRPLRLNGPWLRYKLYTATAPDNTNRLFIHDKKAGFTEKVPTVYQRFARAPPPVPLRPLNTFIPGPVVPAGGTGPAGGVPPGTAP